MSTDPEFLRCAHGIRWHIACQDCDDIKIKVLQVRAAHVLLDKCRDGAKVSQLEVARALRVIGETSIHPQKRIADERSVA